MHEVIRFWLDRGAAGYRVDVMHGLIKDAMFRDNPPLDKVERGSQNDVAFKQKHLYDFEQPEVHEIIRGFRRVIDECHDRIMVGEVWLHSSQSLALYVRPDELQQAFNFRFLFCPWEAARFRAQVEDIERILPAGSWPTWTLSNHDFVRSITRHEHGASTAARARLAAVMLLALRGTPFLYYGEEIGMPNVSIARERWRDPVGRDGCRTPMQWSDAPGGGFTSSKTPWLPLGDCAAVNVARQIDDPASMLSPLPARNRGSERNAGAEGGNYSCNRAGTGRLLGVRARSARQPGDGSAELHRGAARNRSPSGKNPPEQRPWT